MSDLDAHLAVVADAVGVTLKRDVARSLLRFGELVEAWNRKINLIGARQPGAVAEVLFTDALVVARGDEWLSNNSHFVDVGSGAGLPVIPILLQRPDLRATSVEPLGKRAAFQRSAAGVLGLESRLTVVQGRVEELAAERFDVALSRATFAPARWLAIGADLAKHVLVFGANPCDLPEDPEASHSYVLPSGAPRVVAAYRFCGRAATDPKRGDRAAGPG